MNADRRGKVSPDLGSALVKFLRHARSDPGRQWLYHPRDFELADMIRREVILDLIKVCPTFRKDVGAGKVVCDFGVAFQHRGRSKTLDLVAGPPKEPPLPARDGDLRRGEVVEPRLILEVKACMTAHRQATTRLVDELLSASDIVRGAAPVSVIVAVVVINVSPTFTSPLRLPGPNANRAGDIDRLISRLVERVGGLSASAGGYDALGLVIVDFDNEKRIEAVAQSAHVPSDFAYARMLRRVCARWLGQP